MKYEHNMIQDLMPLCIDGAASDESKAAVQAHIAECAECAAIWNSMQTEIPAFSGGEAAPDPETEQYSTAAKRVRKRNHLRILAVFFTVVLLAAGGWFVILYRDGFRFTPFSAVKYNITEENRSGLYNDIEPWHDPANTVEELCTVRCRNGDFAMTAALERNAAGEPVVMHFSESDRTERGTFGLWSNNSMIKLYRDGEFAPIFAEFTGNPISGNARPLWAVCHVTDSAVKAVELKASGQIFRLVPENGVAVLDCSEYQDNPHNYNRLLLNPAFAQGKAFDADGNVLYTYEDGEWQPA